MGFEGQVAALRARFHEGRTRPLRWRAAQLRGIARMMEEREDAFVKALHEDLRKPKLEAWGGEIGMIHNEATHALRHLKSWMKPRKVRTPIAYQPGSSRVTPEPYGVALIVGPWNYPVQLPMAPLVGAVAAGNCAIIKPSELAPATAEAFSTWLPQYVDPECVTVIQGGASETTALLEQRFDYIFYTGSTRVGKIVMQAAARHLTPLTLELGGKSPCIVLEDANLDVAARRIVWGKFFNAGQTCIAPDYVLVHASQEGALLEKMKDAIVDFFGEHPQRSHSFGRIINSAHFDRLQALLTGGEVVCGGEHDARDRFIAPTLLRNVSEDAQVMREEIFGPILPVLTIDNTSEAIDFVNGRPKPLALYLFSESKEADRVLDSTSSGNACINDVVVHASIPDLPFGGVGASGMGAYHGKASFDTFSHHKGIHSKPTFGDNPLRYPPYTQNKLKWWRRLL